MTNKAKELRKKIIDLYTNEEYRPCIDACKELIALKENNCMCYSYRYESKSHYELKEYTEAREDAETGITYQESDSDYYELLEMIADCEKKLNELHDINTKYERCYNFYFRLGMRKEANNIRKKMVGVA